MILRLFIISLVFLLSSGSFAMECVASKLKDKFESADFVFMGTVVQREKIQDNGNGICWNKGELCGPKVATLAVEEIWKGNMALKDVRVYSEDACYCVGTYYELDQRYIVYGNAVDSENFEIHGMGACYSEIFDDKYSKKTIKKLNKFRKSIDK